MLGLADEPAIPLAAAVGLNSVVRNIDPQFGQKRFPASTFVPHCGHF
jgi:hypothetical protein